MTSPGAHPSSSTSRGHGAVSRWHARTLFFILLLLAITQADAANAPKTHSLFLSLQAGQQGFDRDAGLEDEQHASVGLGFRLSDRHSMELSVGRTGTAARTAAAADIAVDTRRLDMLWHYFRSSSWQPYVLTGVGQDEHEIAGTDHRGTFVQAGAGWFRHLAGPFHARIEARALYQFDDDVLHGVATLGVSCAFGGDYLGPPPATPTTSVPGNAP